MSASKDGENRIDQARTLIDTSEPSPKVAKVERYALENIIGQPRAVRNAIRALEIYEAGLTEPGMPAMISLFAGPPGVGKTELAFVLARGWIGKLRKAFNGELIEPVTIVNGTEYTERHDISNLKGASKNYVGYDEPTPLMQPLLDRYHGEILLRNALSRFLREKAKKYGKSVNETQATPGEMEKIWESVFGERATPLKKVLLFDEIEKSHRSLWNLLISIMNGKVMTFTNGVTTDFSGTALLMSTNIGEERIQRLLKGQSNIGFSGKSWEDMDEDVQETMLFKIVEEEIKNRFPAPFVSRVKKNIVVFRPLQGEDWRRILDLRLSETSRLFKESGQDRPKLDLVFTDACKDLLIQHGVDTRHGARPMRDTIRKYVLFPLARAVNTKSLESGDRVVVDVDGTGKKKKTVIYKEP
jgi:ATP-dependent Clp protease ATP-binding subunit ClpC